MTSTTTAPMSPRCCAMSSGARPCWSGIRSAARRRGGWHSVIRSWSPRRCWRIPPLYLGEPAEHESNEIVKLFPLMRDRAIAWQREGVDLDRAAATIAGDPAGPDPAVRIGDVVFDEAVRAQADGQLRMDPEVLTATVDGTTLAAADTTAPVAAPVLILAADDALVPAFPSAHEQRLARTHPAVEVIRIPGAGHLIHDGRASRAIYTDQLVGFLRRATD